MAVKYIFVTGGVVSGLGKGITAASLGRLLKERGYCVTIQKFDPYINVDPGTMSPFQHGEVFVTDDGAECDLDVGHYERFIDENLSVDSDVTSGSIYWNILNKERQGYYEGGTVQIIPHITNEIKNCIYKVGNADNTDIVITEIGGTVGDIESLPFLEAIRQVASEVGRENAMYIHVTLVPCVPGTNELKSKPTQHSVKELLSLGIQPNIIVCRADYPLPDDMRQKLSLFCNVRVEDIVQNLTVPTLYEAPIMLEEEGIAKSVCYHLRLDKSDTPPMVDWRNMVHQIKNAENDVTIGIVGKYTEYPDAYLSLMEAVRHGAIPNNTKVNISLIDSESITESNAKEKLSHCQGIIIPGGFGQRGMEGKINTAKYVRESNIPFLGICMGMQMAVVEYCRNVLKLSKANSSEFDENTPDPIIHIAPDLAGISTLGGTMRLGLYPCKLSDNSLVKKIYGESLINERHRHRYEFNNSYRETVEKSGMIITGSSPDSKMVEIVELPNHPWFVGVQFHPEFKSRPNRPHPLFVSFVETALKQK